MDQQKNAHNSQCPKSYPWKDGWLNEKRWAAENLDRAKNDLAKFDKKRAAA